MCVAGPARRSSSVVGRVLAPLLVLQALVVTPAFADGALPGVDPGLAPPSAEPAIETDALLPHVRLGVIEHYDDLRGQDVRRVIRQKVDHVVHCSDRFAQSGMPLQGTLHLRFVLFEDGEADEIQVDLGKTRLPDMEDCLAPLVARWPLPSDERLGALDVQVSYNIGMAELFIDDGPHFTDEASVSPETLRW